MDAVAFKEMVAYHFLVIVILLLLCDLWFLLLKYRRNKSTLGEEFYALSILVSCFLFPLLVKVEIMRISYVTRLYFCKGSS